MSFEEAKFIILGQWIAGNLHGINNVAPAIAKKGKAQLAIAEGENGNNYLIAYDINRKTPKNGDVIKYYCTKPEAMVKPIGNPI